MRKQKIWSKNKIKYAFEQKSRLSEAQLFSRSQNLVHTCIILFHHTFGPDFAKIKSTFCCTKELDFSGFLS